MNEDSLNYILLLWIVTLATLVVMGGVFTAKIVQLTSKLNNQTGEWQCDRIYYIHPDDVHPSVFIDVGYRNNPLAQPQILSWFCTPNMEKCIGDFKPHAYDDYCTQWKYVKNIDTVMRLPFMREYLTKLSKGELGNVSNVTNAI